MYRGYSPILKYRFIIAHTQNFCQYVTVDLLSRGYGRAKTRTKSAYFFMERQKRKKTRTKGVRHLTAHARFHGKGQRAKLIESNEICPSFNYSEVIG